MTSNFEVPEQLKSRYKDFKPIGAGAMGRVFKATDSILLIDVAIKVLLETRQVRSASAVRFQQEAKAVSKLQHKNILTVMDFGITDKGEPYLVMEFVDGKPLSTILEENKQLNLAQALNITGQICDGMEHAHNVGVIHRDLKPENIIVLGSDLSTASIRILDFGIAKVETVEVEPNSVTPDRQFLGSPQYMSPEQMSAEAVDRRSDIYSVGCILFRMLSGMHPFQSDSLMELMQAKREKKAPLLNQIGAHPPAASSLEAVIARSLETDKSKRFSSMSEFKDALLSGANVLDSASTIRTEKRFPVAKIVAAFAILGIISVFAFITFRRAEPTPQKEEIPMAPVEIVLKDDVLKKSSRVADFFNVRYGGTVWEAKRQIDDNTLAQLVYEPIVELRLSAQEHLTPKGYAFIARIPKLKVLLVPDAHLGDDSLREIAKAKKLEKLQIDGTGVTDAGVAAFENSNITDFILERTNLSDKGLKSIAKMKKLSRLLISSTHITNAGLKSIRHLPLKALHVETCDINDEGMRNMPGIDVINPVTKVKQPTLESLYLGSCSVSLDGFKAIKSAPLEQLAVSGSLQIDDGCVEFFVRNWPRLRMLMINDTGATKRSVIQLGALTGLEECGLASLNLSDDDLLPILKLPHLTVLNLSVNKITDTTLERFKGCTSLRKVDLSQCSGITLATLKRVQRETGKRFICPLLTIENENSLEDIADFMGKQ